MKMIRPLAFVLFTIGSLSTAAATVPTCDKIVAEATLRRMATHFVAPDYPERAVNQNIQGIAVAKICVPAGGKLAAIRMIVAPDESIRIAVKESLAKSEFGPMWPQNDPQHPFSYGGTLVFYFVKQNKRWVVLNPAESFFVGPKFSAPSSRSVAVGVHSTR